jgi:hypothetical protein
MHQLNSNLIFPFSQQISMLHQIDGSSTSLAQRIDMRYQCLHHYWTQYVHMTLLVLECHIIISCSPILWNHWWIPLCRSLLSPWITIQAAENRRVRRCVLVLNIFVSHGLLLLKLYVLCKDSNCVFFLSYVTLGNRSKWSIHTFSQVPSFSPHLKDVWSPHSCQPIVTMP